MKFFLSKILLFALLLLAGVAGAAENSSPPESILWGSDRLAKAMPVDPELAPVRTDQFLRFTLPRDTLRPGVRYLDAVLEITEPMLLKGLQWQATLFSSAGDEATASSVQPVSATKATFRFDARTLKSGVIQVDLLKGDRKLASVREVFSSEPEYPLTHYGESGVLIDDPLAADEEDTIPAWVTFGFPVPAGALWDYAGLQLEDEDGNQIPAQFHSTAHWAEHGSQKWLRVDAIVDGNTRLNVRNTGSAEETPGKLQVEKSGNAIRVDTGPASYLIEPHGALLTSISSDGKSISKQSKNGRGLYVIDQNDRLGRVSAEDTTVEVEFHGNLAARVRVNGIFRPVGKRTDNEEMARFTVWFDFAAGRAECRINHHFILTRDSNEIWFKAIGWDFDLEGWQAEHALFAAKRKDTSAVENLPLGKESLAMVQTNHRRYQGGADQFTLGKTGDQKSLRDGEMGDWAAAYSGDRGLMIGCHESARQHPKAFSVSASRLSLDLFHPGAGEELDFRAPALIERWNSGNLLPDKLIASTEKLPTNAIGWSKTHVITLCPASGPEVPAELKQAGNAFTFPAQAIPDPNWTYRTRVAGPLYPRNTERFPQIESFIDEAFEYWEGEQDHLGEYGFVDFFAGPHHTRTFPESQGRFRASYTLRNAFWLLYLRSGERKFRDMASGSNRTYLDSYISAWDGPSRLRGLYTHSVGPNDPYAGLPFYWEGFTRPSLGTHTNLDQFLLDYYLTGNPRAKDGVLNYAEGVQRWWKESQSDWRILAVLRAVNRAYSFTWDAELRAMQHEILNSIYDSSSPVFLTHKGRPYESSTYKTQEDLSAMIEGWELHGTQRYWNIATAVSRFWWQSLTPGSRFEAGRSGAFLWETDGDLSIAQHLWLMARHEITLPPEGTSAAAELRFQGMPYALSAIVESNADKSPAASWAGVEILTGNAGVLISKKEQTEPIRASLLFQRTGLQDLPSIQTPGTVSRIGQRMVTLRAAYSDGMTLMIPPETEEADFYVPVPEYGIHLALLNDRSPMALYADGWWKPSPETLNPAATIYFNVPKESDNPSIHFEKPTRLTSPDGKLWPDGEEVRGKVALPGDQPGIWQFSSPGGGAVRAAGIPPVFSLDSPDDLAAVEGKLPDLPKPSTYGLWEGEPLASGKTMTLASPEVPLPFREGTIEFFYKPNWNSFDLKSRTVKRLLQLPTQEGRPWHLLYVVDEGRAGWPGHLWSKSHVLEMEIESKGDHPRPRTLCVRKTIFEEDEWVHVAIVWGERMFGYTADRTRLSFDVKVYINGIEGRFASWPRQGNRAASPPQSLIFGPDLDGEISNLRISGNRRYTSDFSPPEPDKITSDSNTLYFDTLSKDAGNSASPRSSP